MASTAAWSSGSTVVTGCASTPLGSESATPTRTEPTSMPIRTPSGCTPRCTPCGCPGASPVDGTSSGWLPSVGELTDTPLDRGERILDGLWLAASALGEVVLAATAPAEDLCSDPDQLAGLDPSLTSRLVGRDDNHGSPALGAGHRDDHGAVGAESTARVEDHGAGVVAAGVVAGIVAEEADRTHVARVVRQA